jgi:restriction system protein
VGHDQAVAIWLIRGGEGNVLVDEFTSVGVTGVGYPSIPDASDLSREEVEHLLTEAGSSGAISLHASMLDAFAHQVQPGDVVLMPDTPRHEMVVGEVTGPYRYDPEVPAGRYRHRRAVNWFARHAFADLPEEHQGLYRQRHTLARLDAPELVDHVVRVTSGEVGRPARERRGIGGRRPRRID